MFTGVPDDVGRRDEISDAGQFKTLTRPINQATCWSSIEGTPSPYRLAFSWRQRRRAAGDGAIVSPMPGKIIAVAVKQGEAVTKGQKLLTLEAMKMEHSLAAPVRWHSRPS